MTDAPSAPSTKTRSLALELLAAQQRVEELELQLAKQREKAPRPKGRKRERVHGACEHLTSRDHIVAHTSMPDSPGDVRAVWRCSKCGAQDVWGPGWMYYGNVECKRCSEADIERVYCPACSLGYKPEPDEKVIGGVHS